MTNTTRISTTLVRIDTAHAFQYEIEDPQDGDTCIEVTDEFLQEWIEVKSRWEQMQERLKQYHSEQNTFDATKKKGFTWFNSPTD